MPTLRCSHLAGTKGIVVKEKLLDMLRLEKGWNGYSALPPDDMAVGNALRFVDAAEIMEVKIKKVEPSPLEGVCVIVKKWMNTVVVELLNRGTARALFTNETTDSIHAQGVVVSPEGYITILKDIKFFLGEAVRKASNKGPKKPNTGFVPKKPTRYSEEEVGQALKECGGYMYSTAAYLDVNYNTVKSYLKRWPRLRRIKKECLGLMVDRVENALITQALKGNVRAMNRILSHYGKDRGWEPQYKTVNQIVTPPTPTDVPKLTEEVKQRLLDDARKRYADQQKKSAEGLKQLECGLKMDIPDAEVVDESNPTEIPPA